MCSVVRQLAEEELQAWAVGFAGQLLESAPLSVAVLHQAVGARLTAWVSGIRTLDDDTCAVSLARARLGLQDLAGLYSRCRCLLCPRGAEDFCVALL